MGRQGTPRTDASRASLAHRVGAYVSAHRLRRRWFALMGVLAAVVVVVTAGALTMPASTMTADVATLPEGASVPEGYTQQYTAKDEANGITVTAYAPEGVVPEGATLKASLLAQDSDEYAAAKQATGATDEEGAGFAAMDISFVDADGSEVEPTGDVYVNIDAAGILPEDADPESVTVQHLAEDESCAVASVDTVADAAGGAEGVVAISPDDVTAVQAAFTTDSLSTYTVTWKTASVESDSGSDSAAVEAYGDSDDVNSADAANTGTNLLQETFTGAEPSNPDAWKFFGAAGLTAAGQGSGTYQVKSTQGSWAYIGSNHGEGYLQLTDASNAQTGTVLYNEPVQSSLGLDIKFYQWQFNNTTGEPADGIGFFLVDGSTDLSEQGPQGDGFGGALGYSAIKINDHKTEPGLANGVLGVGLDVWGNYSAKESVGGSDTRDATDRQPSHTYSVTVRGAGKRDQNGDWTQGYGILAQNKVGNSLLQTSVPDQNKGQNVPGQSNGTLVNIHITPTDEKGDQYITVTLTNGTTTETPINNVKLEEKLPALVKFGFSASTGANNDVHFIRGLNVNTVLPAQSSIFMTKSVNHDETQGGVSTSKTTFAAGETVPYTFVVHNAGGKTLSNVHIDDPLIKNVYLEGGEQTSTTLASDQQAVFYGSLVLTEDQARAGSLTNTATAIGNDGEKDITTDDSVTIGTEIPSEPVEPLGEPEHSKKIGDNGDGTYTLALDVAGKTQTSGSTSTTPVDVVMIIDKSSSMNDAITTTPVTTYLTVDAGDVVKSDGRIETDTYTDLNYPFFHRYQKAVQTSRPTQTYYVQFNGQYVEVTENTETKFGERNTSYQAHVNWTANGNVVDPSTTQFYVQSTSPSSISRIDAVKQAASSFVDSAAQSAGASHIRIGVVSFSGTDSNEDTSDINRELTPVVDGSGGSNAEAIKQTINEIDAPEDGAGTYPDDAFKDANSMLSSSADGTRKVVIFFTDGGPGAASSSGWWGSDSWDIENNAANDAVAAALPLKQNGTTIYSVGVLDNANPAADISHVNANSEDVDKINAFMHAVSSNYPAASAFTSDKIGTRTPNSDYYKIAENADQLNEIFQDIFHDTTRTQAYSNVAIVDELSQWARVADTVTWETSEDAQTSSGYRVTDGVSFEVKDASGNTVQPGAAGYPDSVVFYYNPAGADAVDTTGTLTAVLGDGYELQDGWTYTLKFNVVPTAAAYNEYADGGYPDTGSEGTDLYTGEDNTPEGAVSCTSAGKRGFNSNNSAYVSYSVDDEKKVVYYDHPVLQASEIVSIPALQEKKTVDGMSASAGEFTFTVTTEGETAEEAMNIAGLLDGDTPAIAQGDGTWVYEFSNPAAIQIAENQESSTSVIRSSKNSKGLTFNPTQVGKTYTYIYREEQPEDKWQQLAAAIGEDSATEWKVDIAVERANDGTLQAVVKISMPGENDAWVPFDEKTYTSESEPIDPLVIPFENAIKPEVIIQKVDQSNNPLSGAEFALVSNGENESQPVAASDDDGAIFNLGALEDGSYTLIETKAPDGYQLPKDNVTFSIYHGKITSPQCGTKPLEIVDGNTIVVPNSTGKELPNTGGSGTTPLILGGLLLVAAAGCGYGLRRRHEGRGTRS